MMFSSLSISTKPLDSSNEQQLALKLIKNLQPHLPSCYFLGSGKGPLKMSREFRYEVI